MAQKKQDLKTTLPKYEVNPSLKTLSLNTKNRRVFSTENTALIITDSKTGEEFGASSVASFIRPETVDTEQFIKIYTSGISQLSNLSSAGHKVFGVIYKLMLANQDADRLYIEFNDLAYKKLWLNARVTFIRGMNDLLENSILFQSISPNMYFVNVQYFFNGNRINIVKSYQLKQSDFLENLEE